MTPGLALSCAIDVDGVVGDLQAVVNVCRARIRLHADRRCEVAARADGGLVEVDDITTYDLVLAKGIVNADVLIDIRGRCGGIDIFRDNNVVIQNLRPIVAMWAAGTKEHPDAQVEIVDQQVRDRPVLVYARASKVEN